MTRRLDGGALFRLILTHKSRVTSLCAGGAQDSTKDYIYTDPFTFILFF